LESERVDEFGEVVLVGFGQCLERGAGGDEFVVDQFDLLGFGLLEEDSGDEEFVGVVCVAPE